MSYTKRFIFNDFVRLNFDVYEYYIQNSEVKLNIAIKDEIHLSGSQEIFVVSRDKYDINFLFSLKNFGDCKNNKFYFNTKYKASSIVKKFLINEEYYSFVEWFNNIANSIIEAKQKEEKNIRRISSEEEFETFVDDLISSKTKVS